MSGTNECDYAILFRMLPEYISNFTYRYLYLATLYPYALFGLTIFLGILLFMKTWTLVPALLFVINLVTYQNKSLYFI
jgi:hypothetical protein